MRLSDIMRTRVVTIGPDASASAAWTRMRKRGIRHLVVKDGTRLLGIISEQDLGGRAGTTTRNGRAVRDLMTPRVVSAGPETALVDAADQMRAQLIGSLPVLQDGRLVGIVTATDVFDALGSEAMGPLDRADRQLFRAPSSSERREPLPARVPKPLKRTAGRTSAPAATPANIRVTGVSLDEDERAYIRRRLGEKLGKYASAIERVTVRVEDVNGPRGGVDQVCRIKVVLSGLPSVVVEQKAAAVKPAVTAALTGVERAVRRAVERRRRRPVRGASGGAGRDDGASS